MIEIEGQRIVLHSTKIGGKIQIILQTPGFLPGTGGEIPIEKHIGKLQAFGFVDGQQPYGIGGFQSGLLEFFVSLVIVAVIQKAF